MNLLLRQLVEVLKDVPYYCYNDLSASMLIHSWEAYEETIYYCCNILSISAFGRETLTIKLLKNDKLLKFCYLVEDYEDLKPDVEVIKVLTEESEDSEDTEDLKPDCWRCKGSD